MNPRPILNRQETDTKIKRDLAIAKRKMDQILTDQVNSKLTKSQYNKLSALVGFGAELNKTKDRQHANEQIFLREAFQLKKRGNLGISPKWR